MSQYNTKFKRGDLISVPSWEDDCEINNLLELLDRELAIIIAIEPSNIPKYHFFTLRKSSKRNDWLHEHDIQLVKRTKVNIDV